jgi:uncharacterized protein (TIGR00730 family)
MKSICVFCGSSTGKDQVYKNEVALFGKLLAERQITLVYGGGKVGLMGILADSVLKHGGKCIGVIPQSIADLEIAHDNLTELFIVDNMHQRKAMMSELSDGFIAFPGGFGTLDELSEVLTYSQLRIYDKPIGLFNINGYFDHLLLYLDHMVNERFVRSEHRQNIIVEDNAPDLLEKLNAYQPVHIDKWIKDIKEESSLN